jgi:dTDP-4-dehydrorhamnose reductase
VRVYLTGGSGFVGSNVAHVFARRHAAEVIAPRHAEVDLVDPAAVRDSVEAARPDAVVHCAILNDWSALTARRRTAREAYVGATRTVVDAANAVGAPVLLVSTDWVFDGTQGPAAEDEPPNPVNAYGFYKAASELVVTERARHGVVARIAGVQGVHRARPQAPRAQDAGFGYLVASLVDALAAGERFAVWDGDGLNRLATPVLAGHAAEMMWRALDRGASGILHCCGGEHIDRVGLARRAVDAFALDPALLDVVPPPPGALPPGRVPVDTRLSAVRTVERLDMRLPTVVDLLAGLRSERDEAGRGAQAT